MIEWVKKLWAAVCFCNKTWTDSMLSLVVVSFSVTYLLSYYCLLEVGGSVCVRVCWCHTWCIYSMSNVNIIRVENKNSAIFLLLCTGIIICFEFGIEFVFRWLDTGVDLKAALDCGSLKSDVLESCESAQTCWWTKRIEFNGL